MQIVINDLINGKCLCRKAYPTEFISAGGIEESGGHFNYTGGQINFCDSWFEGMRITTADVDASAIGSLEVESDTPTYTMLFCLEGNLKLKTPIREIILQANHGVFVHTPAYSAKCELPYSGKAVCIQLTEKCYNKFTNNEERYQVTGSEPVLKINPAMQMILKSIGECTHSSLMRRIFLETGVLQLLLMQLEQISSKPATQNMIIKEHDIERIQYAKALIDEDIRNPCSLIELAHKAGLNDFKLKKGFKELYGMTVFGYLHEIRMEKAWKMLFDEKRSVSDVSHEVGYKNPHHFTAAFRKKFGVLPGQLNK